MYFSKTTRHALFPVFMRMLGLFSPRVTRAHKKRTLTSRRGKSKEGYDSEGNIGKTLYSY